jgi:hypothetical protein
MAVNARINTGGNIGQVKLTQQTRSTIAAQNFAPKPNVAISDVAGVNVAGAQNGQVLQFDSVSGKFVANTVTATVVSVNGGAF